MSIFDCLRGGRARDGMRAWHEAWAKAIQRPDAAAVAELETSLHRQPPAGDLELEEEMLDALRQLVGLAYQLREGRLPRIETSHRVVGADLCHFSAPVSIPDDPAQPTGRLLLTSTRAAFAGGGRVPPLAWHAVRDVVQRERDVLFVHAAADDGVRFRCNSFADAVCAAAIARCLVGRTRQPRTL